MFFFIRVIQFASERNLAADCGLCSGRRISSAVNIEGISGEIVCSSDREFVVSGRWLAALGNGKLIDKFLEL